MVNALNNQAWLKADWEAPVRIKAGISTRHGGYSLPPYNGLNLAKHVGDKQETVELNRRTLNTLLDLPGEPEWLEQVHGKHIIEAGKSDKLQADGSYTDRPGQVCVVLTADCLPLLVCNKKGTRVAAVHVGWRGYCAGIVASALNVFSDAKEELIVWIGPHIKGENYEVGDEVYHSCLKRNKNADSCFTKSYTGRWYASLEMLVRQELTESRVNSIFADSTCTYDEETDFFSYRRENITGRMASMIWIEDQGSFTI